ncbi:MAG: 2'-5' RNA ligase family protein [Rhodothermales bacterium]
MRPNWFIGFPVDWESWHETVITNVPAGIKCLSPVDLHVTFAFFGAVGEENARRAWDEMKERVFPAFGVSLGPMELFGDPDKPSAYALTLEKGRENAISCMQTHRDHLLSVAGSSPEKYKPRPHITIARPPRSASDTLRLAGESWALSVTPPDTQFNLDKLALYTWADDRSVQQFKIVSTLKLD